jgi:hypothetical protein
MKKIIIYIVLGCSLLGLSIYIIFYNQDTRFIDELQVQLIRILTINQYEEESKYAKFVLAEIINNENPPNNWKDQIGERSQRFGDGLFYFFKVWFIESKTTLSEIEHSYIIIPRKVENGVLLNLRYGNAKPTIQFCIVRDENNKLKADFTFPLNNCTFDADYNGDRVYNIKDVNIAKERAIKIKG